MKRYESPSVEMIAFCAVESVANDDDYSENIQYDAMFSK